MSTLKYSRQRESIKVCLQGRKDHPTASVLQQEMARTGSMEILPRITISFAENVTA